eukprot:m.42635 g.42635  ORF g.42635 m.42635 type:complete len:1099 (-) comp14521_c0_seq1:93-3389(-)
MSEGEASFTAGNIVCPTCHQSSALSAFQGTEVQYGIERLTCPLCTETAFECILCSHTTFGGDNIVNAKRRARDHLRRHHGDWLDTGDDGGSDIEDVPDAMDGDTLPSLADDTPIVEIQEEPHVHHGVPQAPVPPIADRPNRCCGESGNLTRAVMERHNMIHNPVLGHADTDRDFHVNPEYIKYLNKGCNDKERSRAMYAACQRQPGHFLLKDLVLAAHQAIDRATSGLTESQQDAVGEAVRAVIESVVHHAADSRKNLPKTGHQIRQCYHNLKCKTSVASQTPRPSTTDYDGTSVVDYISWLGMVLAGTDSGPHESVPQVFKPEPGHTPRGCTAETSRRAALLAASRPGVTTKDLAWTEGSETAKLRSDWHDDYNPFGKRSVHGSVHAVVANMSSSRLSVLYALGPKGILPQAAVQCMHDQLERLRKGVYFYVLEANAYVKFSVHFFAGVADTPERCAIGWRAGGRGAMTPMSGQYLLNAREAQKRPTLESCPTCCLDFHAGTATSLCENCHNWDIISAGGTISTGRGMRVAIETAHAMLAADNGKPGQSGREKEASSALKRVGCNDKCIAEVVSTAAADQPAPHNPYHDPEYSEHFIVVLGHLRSLGLAKAWYKDVFKKRLKLFGQAERAMTFVSDAMNLLIRNLRVPFLDLAPMKIQPLWIAVNHAAFLRVLPWLMHVLARSMRLGKQEYARPPGDPKTWKKPDLIKWCHHFKGFDEKTKDKDGKKVLKKVDELRADVVKEWIKEPQPVFEAKAREHGPEIIHRLGQALHRLNAALSLRDGSDATVASIRDAVRHFLDTYIAFEKGGPPRLGKKDNVVFRRPNLINLLLLADQAARYGNQTEALLNDMLGETYIIVGKQNMTGADLHISNVKRFLNTHDKVVLFEVRKLLSISRTRPPVTIVDEHRDARSGPASPDAEHTVADDGAGSRTEHRAGIPPSKTYRQKCPPGLLCQVLSGKNAREHFEEGRPVPVVGHNVGGKTEWGIPLFGDGTWPSNRGHAKDDPGAHWLRLDRNGTDWSRGADGGYTVFMSFTLAAEAELMTAMPPHTGVFLPEIPFPEQDQVLTKVRYTCLTYNHEYLTESMELTQPDRAQLSRD